MGFAYAKHPNPGGGGHFHAYVSQDLYGEIDWRVRATVSGMPKASTWDVKLRRMIAHLLHARPTPHGQYFGREVVRWIHGRSETTSNLPVQPLFDLFSKIGHIEPTGWSWRGPRRYARCVRVDWGDLAGPISRDLESNAALVDCITGLPLNRETLRCDLRAFAESKGSPASPEICTLLGRLNAQEANLFEKMLPAIPEAIEEVRSLPLRDPSKRGKIEYEAESSLRAIRACPQPFYMPVDRSPRIYAASQTFLNLKSAARDVLMRRLGLASLDLDKAQLRIVGELWDLPEVLRGIDEGDLWRRILEPAGLWSDDPREAKAAKGIAKEVVYGSVFGSEIHHAARRLRLDYGLDKDAVRVLLGSDFVGSLYSAAKAQIDRLAGGEEIEDALGRVLGVSTSIKGTTERRREARSVLAASVQSYEMAIMLGAAPYAVAWLHDGLWLDPAHVEPAVSGIYHRAQSLGLGVGVEITPPEVV